MVDEEKEYKMGERKHYHRGRRKPVSEKRTAMRDEDTKRTNSTGSRSKRKKKKSAGKGRLISNIVLVVAIIVFCVSGFQLYRIISGYQEGRQEYDQVREMAVTQERQKMGKSNFR